jgi:prephenate dehydratase
VIRVAFQGEPGAYGEEAITRYFGDTATAVAMPTFASVYGSVMEGASDAAVLPLENSVAGTVGDALDTLATGPLEVVGEVLQPIEHQLLVVPGSTLEDIARVSSHWQALAQCDRFLASRGWDVVPAADTAGAARELATNRAPDGAAIASERAASLYGLEIAARAIQDDPHNMTRFAVIAPSRDSLASAHGGSDGEGIYETLVTFETGHRPGDLVRALSVLADAGINLSRIESRPSGEGPWRYRFLIQVAGDAAADPLCAALAEMHEITTSMRVLGSFVPG